MNQKTLFVVIGQDGEGRTTNWFSTFNEEKVNAKCAELSKRLSQIADSNAIIQAGMQKWLTDNPITHLLSKGAYKSSPEYQIWWTLHHEHYEELKSKFSIQDQKDIHTFTEIEIFYVDTVPFEE